MKYYISFDVKHYRKILTQLKKLATEEEEEEPDTSVGMTGNGVDDRDSEFQFPAGAENFSILQRDQTGTEALAAPYPIGIGGSSRGGKAADA
jgi:hypothetical protein